MTKQKVVENIKHKTVTLLTFSTFDISSYLQCTDTSVVRHHEKSKQYLQMINTQLLTKHETLYAIRASDILVIIVDKNYDDTVYSEITKFMPHFIICYTDRNEIKNVRKFAKNTFSVEKIVYIDNLMEQLTLKGATSSICENRPFFVPYKIQYSNNYIEMEGMLRKGFLSKKMIINGVDKAEIVKIVVDGVEYDGGYIDENEQIMDELNKKYTCDEKENVPDESDEISFESEASEDTTQCEPSAIEEYKDYKGISNLSTCNFVTQEYPVHYNDLHFFENFTEIQKRINKLKSKIPDNTYVKVIVKTDTVLNYKHIVCFNMFDIECLKTIYNLHFDTNLNIIENEHIVLDFGHRLLRVTPMISNSSKYKVHVRQTEGDKGCLSFIAPITLNFTKCLIYKNNFYAGIATNNTFCDRIMLDEVKLKGYPRKVDKRYCTVSDMFKSKDEVLFYRNLPVYTKNGNKGIIKKSIGTHGIFKCYFNRPVNHNTPVFLSLYKREFLQDYEE